MIIRNNVHLFMTPYKRERPPKEIQFNSLRALYSFFLIFLFFSYFALQYAINTNNLCKRNRKTFLSSFSQKGML